MAKTSIRSKIRRTDARVVQEKGKTQIVCPFCEIPHPLGLNQSFCGTKLEVKAVQTIYYNAICAMCNKAGGEMFKVGADRYVHVKNCSPGRVLFTKPPKMSLTAMLIHKYAPDALTKLIAKRGATTVEVTNPETKEHIGYAWVRR